MSPADGFTGFKVRKVTLDAFWIDRTEVTNAQYQAFLTATAHPPPAFWGDTWRPRWATC